MHQFVTAFGIIVGVITVLCIAASRALRETTQAAPAEPARSTVSRVLMVPARQQVCEVQVAPAEQPADPAAFEVEKARRMEEIGAAIEELDSEQSAVASWAFSGAQRETKVERPGVYAVWYRQRGEKLEARMLSLMQELASLDPERAYARVWAGVVESWALYHWNLAAQVHQMECDICDLDDKPHPPFAPVEVIGAFREALDAYTQVAQLRSDGWSFGLKIGELRWRLQDRAGAIAALNEFVALSDDPKKRLKARGILEEIAKHGEAKVA
jgi:hypothetical protein